MSHAGEQGNAQIEKLKIIKLYHDCGETGWRESVGVTVDIISDAALRVQGAHPRRLERSRLAIPPGPRCSAERARTPDASADACMADDLAGGDSRASLRAD